MGNDSSTSSQSDCSDSSTSSQSDCSGYGNIMDVKTTGASWDTAQQDGPGSVSKEEWTDSDGRMASRTMAETDADRMRKYRREIDKVGSDYGIDPSLIAAIISRESRAGNTLHNGWGDYDRVRKAYNAWGLMQVDVNPNGGNHTPEGAWDSEKHLRQATRILVDFIKKIQGKKSFSGLSKEQQLKGGIAAYNTGDGNVHTYKHVDENTTGKDYSNDVVARAKWYKTHRSRWDRLQ